MLRLESRPTDPVKLAKAVAVGVAVAALCGLAVSGEQRDGENAYRSAPLELREWYVSQWRDELEKAISEHDKATTAFDAIQAKKSDLRKIRSNKLRREAEAKWKQESESAQAAIDRAENKVDRLRKNDPPHIPPLSEKAPTGAVGTFGGPQSVVKVEQVIGPDRMLVTTSSWMSTYTVQSNVLRQQRELRTSGPYLVAGHSTEGLADGETVNLNDSLFRLGGTETYSTAIGGTNTVHIIEAVDRFLEETDAD